MGQNRLKTYINLLVRNFFQLVVRQCFSNSNLRQLPSKIHLSFKSSQTLPSWNQQNGPYVALNCLYSNRDSTTRDLYIKTLPVDGRCTDCARKSGTSCLAVPGLNHGELESPTTHQSSHASQSQSRHRMSWKVREKKLVKTLSVKKQNRVRNNKTCFTTSTWF